MAEEQTNGCGAGCGCGSGTAGIARRDFLKAAGVTPLALLGSVKLPVMAGPFDTESEIRLPADEKRLDPAWVTSLTDRGKPTVYTASELDKIGMPIGGIGAGQLYIGGDGKLWHWDIFNIPHGTGDAGYAHPPVPESPLEQGFAVQVKQGETTSTYTLDRASFKKIEFTGQYPIAQVSYGDALCPVSVSLEAFSPFIPLNADDSSLPATILNYTITNRTKEPVEVSVIGWLQNMAAGFTAGATGVHRNHITAGDRLTVLESSAEKSPKAEQILRPELLFEDWSHEVYTGWKSEGAAFGTGPIKRKEIPDYQGDVGGDTERVVNSHATAPGRSVEEKDRATGKLTSSPFTVERSYLRFWIGGGSHRGTTCLNLIVDGKVVRSTTGRDNNKMSLQSFDIRALHGKQAIIEIVDNETAAWGNIGVGRIVQTDGPPSTTRLEELPDFGTLALGLIGEPAQHAAAASTKIGFTSPNALEVSLPLEETLIGSLGRRAHLQPGESTTVRFVVAWHFPNLSIDGLGRVGRYYAVRFTSAKAVVSYVANQYDRLTSQTRLWRDTWYDSTLPHWFLDRTLLNISTLATGACYRFANGRFYAWEGVGCCAGTCTHVWHYAHAMARLFPELERDTRERVDFGIAYHANSGVIGFRAEYDTSLAVDGQAGTLLRAYREHQMSADSGFLRRNWPRIKGAFEPLFHLDKNQDGVLLGGQMNTLDQPWYGQVSWLSSLYIAALRAGAAMATEMNEPEFAARCTRLADSGSQKIDANLFNGEYYIQTPDPANPRAVGSYDGCEIDQVFGAGWAGQVGLAGVLPQANVRKALKSLWNYSFLMDVGPYREAHKPGRWYALAGEAGLLMCSWPKGEGTRSSGGFDFYLNECMTGFEHQAAGHMLREGLVTEGLAVIRAIHDRYHASKRNPWTEVECGDHYSRAMASFGVYLSAIGYTYHGPKAHLAFAPRFGADKFKAAFTAAEGWGTYSQSRRGSGSGQTLSATIELKHGTLRLESLQFAMPDAAKPTRLRVTLDSRPIKATFSVADESVGDAGGGKAVTLSIPGLLLRSGRTLRVQIA